MNRVLEKVFPSFSRHARPRGYYSFTEGSSASSFSFRVEYQGEREIEDGRVILFLGHKAGDEPRLEAFDLEAPLPLFAKDVTNVRPGDVIEFDSTEFTTPSALAFVPENLSHFKSELYAQALVNLNTDDPDANTCVGNVYSAPVQIKFDGANPSKQANIVADKVIVDEMKLETSEWMEHVSMKSELLSEYHGKDVHMMASVVLPKGYQSGKEAGIKYPVVYYIEGFTGTESYATRAQAFLSSEMGDEWKAGRWPTPMIRVTLGSRFKFGHTSFADTEVNGPWGTALVSEFIPFLESKVAAVSAANGRFLHGHSSGGWSTLWLQLQFPDFFGGAWSSAPDPVDFSKFQVVNIYKADNMYWDPNGFPYPTSRSNGKVECTNRDENLLERVYGRGNGGQWDAFAALFSPRDADGMPIPLFDKMSGKIDHAIAQYWARYDIYKFVSSHPELLTTKLRGKVHVICGFEDTYYLNGACESLQQLVGRKQPKSEDESVAVPSYVDMVPGDHTNIRSREHYNTVYQEIAATFKLGQQQQFK